MNEKQALIIPLMDTVFSSSSSDDGEESLINIDSDDVHNDLEMFMEDDDLDNEETLFLGLTRYLFKFKKERAYQYFIYIESWNESEFRNRMGISKISALSLIDELEKSGYIASHIFGVKPLEAKVCFYIFLSFLISTKPLTSIANNFDISVSSTFRVIRKVVAWILTKMNTVIRWPETETEFQTITKSFEHKTGLSNMLGVIDSTHIKIEQCRGAKNYKNSKGYSSILLLYTVDANCRFTSIYCGEPGSTNACITLRNSPLYNTAQTHKETIFPNSTYIIGDAKFPLLRWLKPPFRENKTITEDQRYLNYYFGKARKLSSKAIQMLKGKFKRIQNFRVYKKVEFVIDAVGAVCILHNYCLDVDRALPS